MLVPSLPVRRRLRCHPFRLVTGFVCLLFAGLPGCGGAASSEREGSLDIRQDGTAQVSGRVVENQRGCEVDGVCRLVVEAGGRRVLVVYDAGDTAEACSNREASDRGFGMEAGDRVEAFGAYRDSGPGPVIFVCSSESYFLRSP